MTRVPYLRLVEPMSSPERPKSRDRVAAELVFTVVAVVGRALRLAFWIALGLIIGGIVI